MPAEGVHLTAVREAMASSALSPAARTRMVRRDDAARFGAILVDLPYFHRFAGEVLRYVAGIPARPSSWGMAFHEGAAIDLLGALLAVARRHRDPTLGAIALGLASHCAIDRALHPLINALAREHRGGKNHDASHREVEKFQSICFHEQYMGRDLMGDPGITRYLTIQLAEAAPVDVMQGVQQAWQQALGSAPSIAELRGYTRGYRMHVRLLGSPLGRRIAPPAAKDVARPRYVAGTWGTFPSLLEQAIAVSIPVLDAAATVLDASTHDVAAAQAALAALLPAGTIDPAGLDVDLSRLVAVGLGR